MKKEQIILLMLIVFVSTSFGQRSKKYKRHSGPNQEIGLSLGVSNYNGDLAWKGNIPIFTESNPAAFRPAGGLFYRNNFTNFTSFKASFGIGELFGDDSQTNGDPARINRNLHFRSIVADVALMLEWNIAPYRIGDKKKMFTPFIGIGVAGFYFNPQAQLNGRWVDLQPLGTEGQGILPGTKKYSLFQFAIPASIGVKANITRKIALSLDIQYRYTFTDYIDDVSSFTYVDPEIFYNNYISAIASDADALSYRAIDTSLSPRALDQRGSPDANDHFYYVLLSISYKIGKSSSTCYTFR